MKEQTKREVTHRKEDERKTEKGDRESDRRSFENKLRVKMVEHLSAEIVSLTGFQTSHRTRMGFTVLIGPFIVLGSFLIATDGSIPSRDIDVWDWLAGILAALAYVGFAFHGAAIDQRTLDQCNEWRRDIAGIWSDESPSEKTPLLPAPAVYDVIYWPYYLIGAALMLLAFLPITFICIRRLSPIG